MPTGTVEAIYISMVKGDPMIKLQEVLAIAGAGLEGDRYATGDGSWNKGQQGKRQVTLINARFFPATHFTYAESRRNIITRGIDLAYLIMIQKEFAIGDAVFRAVKYCDPCPRPSELVKNQHRFDLEFEEVAGIICEIVRSGIIKVGSEIIRPPRN